ncbi:cadmium-translocating P-type ATPase [Spongiibacter sp. KMU-158]|uniref:Cadmium-translocating P-type ATPase n=1 Tax=Spongiibacter pelagi TaxID=2760804 RepID=A0A927BZ28_9GAMM|nr:heavy metal translocating P-type ATPase [Spongiibacter pelagi]MBD2858210.1 cadmium-translocating P-type ATPase [Spongiibacter pelagi]
MTLACYHCGQTVPKNSSYALNINGANHAMCCPACVAVAECIQQAGLSDYYRLRSDNPDTPKTDKADFTLFNNTAVLRRFSEYKADRWHSRLSLSGIHCAACTWLIEHHLIQLDGVDRIDVNLQNAVAHIVWNPQQTSMSEIMAAIQELGYQPLPDSPDQRQQLLRDELSKNLRRLGLAGIGMMQVGMVAIGLYAGDFQGIDNATRDLLRYFSLIITTPILLYSGQPFFKGAWRSVKARAPGMDVPVSLALIAAYLASVYATMFGLEHVYFDTVSMFIFFLLLSRYLQARLRLGQFHQAQLLPEAARLINTTAANSDSQPPFRWQAIAELVPGDRIFIPPGEIIPADGIVTAGSSRIETSAFNGEFLPQSVTQGCQVLAGSGNIEASLEIEVTASAENSSLNAMQKLLAKAQSEKPHFAQLADRLASRFVIAVILVALISFAYWAQFDLERAFIIALSVLVVSCPCALSLATPTTYAAAITALRRRGIVLRNSLILERLKKLNVAVFDKTGTLTLGRARIESIEWLSPQNEAQQKEILAIAAAMEADSTHPLAQAFKTESENTVSLSTITIFAGEGIQAKLAGLRYRIGKAAFCEKLQTIPTSTTAKQHTGSEVLLVNENQALARFWIADQIRPGAAELISAFASAKMSCQLLSGDRAAAVDALANKLNINHALSECSAANKVAHIQQLQSQGKTVLMLGDGVNDAPVMACADVSIAMSAASDLTRNQADVLLISDSLSQVQTLFDFAQATRHILRQNIFWALLYNGTAIPLAAMGLIAPWLAAIGMSASSLIVVLNALRLNRVRAKNKTNIDRTATALESQLSSNRMAN